MKTSHRAPSALVLLFCVHSVFALGCRPGAPLLRAQYGATLPLMGAPKKLTHTIAVGAGILETGPGVGFGGALDIRFRPAGEVTGGAFGASLINAITPENPRMPFSYSQLGAGLIGTSAVATSGSESGTFDLMSPHFDTALGIPVGRGFAVSLGISLQYLVRLNKRSDEQNILLGSATLGVGFFDPHVAPNDNALSFFFH